MTPKKTTARKPRTKTAASKTAKNTSWGSEPVRVQRSWSSHQQRIFDNVANDTGHSVVIARAGSGKTTTIVESLYHVPAGKSILAVAFNKSIKEALDPLVPNGVDVSTLHSLGLRTIFRGLGKAKLEQYKSSGIIANIIGNEPEKREYAEQIAKCVSLAKGHLYDQAEQLDDLIDDYGIEAGRGQERSDFIDHVQRTLKVAKAKTDIVDYDDMIWFPNVLDLHVAPFDRVFIDETQDLNKAQIQLALKALKDGGRICAVGDDRQAIYGFRGADSKAIPNVIQALNAKTLPLSVTYRCAKAIVDIAKEIVPDLEAAPGAEDGLVAYNDRGYMIKNAKAGDFILSRTNAPLIGLCMGFIREGRSANIQGRDIGSGLIAMIKRSKSKSVSAFVDWVENWQVEEIARLTAKKRDTTAVEDKAACLLSLCEGARTLWDVQQNIQNLFADTDDKTRIILSTTHKAKGLERDRVFMMTSTYRRGKNTEEDNLYYVAVTRARKELQFING